MTWTEKKSNATVMAVVVSSVLGVGSVGAMWRKWFSMKKRSKSKAKAKKEKEKEKHRSKSENKNENMLALSGPNETYAQNIATGGRTRKRR